MNISKSEQNVLVYIKQGISNKQIADKLFVSEKTIKFHLTNIFKKYNVKSRAELTAQLTGYSKKERTKIVTNLDSGNNSMVKIASQEDKLVFIDKQFKVGQVINQLHKMMTEVTKDQMSPATVTAACNCVTRLNETINTAISAAKFLGDR